MARKMTCLSCALALLATGGASAQSCKTTTLYATDFESGSGLDGWATGFLFGNQSATNDWRGIQACTARSGDNIFRFGGESCTGEYTDGQVSYAESPAIVVPADATTTRLSFWHRRDFEEMRDGGRAAVKVDDSTFFFVVQDPDIVSGAAHNGNLIGDCASTAPYADLRVFTGTTTSYEKTVVDLDATCFHVTGESCVGHTVRLGFLSFTDCSFGGGGWFLDDVQVTVCTPSDYYTVTPCRIADTRQTDDPLQPAAERTFALTGSCGIPANAKALAVNLTAVQAAAAGYIQAWPADEEGTATSLLNFAAGQTRANSAVLPLAVDGSGAVKVLAATAAPLHMIIDVTGYFE